MELLERGYYVVTPSALSRVLTQFLIRKEQEVEHWSSGVMPLVGKGGGRGKGTNKSRREVP